MLLLVVLRYRVIEYVVVSRLYVIMVLYVVIPKVRSSNRNFLSLGLPWNQGFPYGDFHGGRGVR